MADLVPVANANTSLLAPLTDPAGGAFPQRARGFFAQGPVKKALPWFAGVAVLGAGALSWGMLAPAPQRTLYTHLDDGERASVVQALDGAKIPYSIDNTTGALTVDEANLYKARMVVAQNGALSMPDTANDSLDKLPMGASRALEDERLRAAKEHELMLSIKEIEGVEAVRVHLAEGQKSVFVRDQIAPSASVMLRLASGRQLSQSQVQAIVNLVAGSVPGLTPDAVKVVDQRGRLLTDKSGQDADRLEMQARLEEKLQGQVSTLLTPMLGDGNFSSEIQVELDMQQVTSARETYDKTGVVRSETSQQSQQPGAQTAAGVPGVLSNTPPVQTQPVAGAPQGTTAPPAAAPAPMATETQASKNYELGREVAVTNQGPGKIKRLSVAVALSSKAMAKAKQSEIDQLKQLVSAAVGADPARGDQVAVVVRSFDETAAEKIPFYEQPWFASALHYGVMLLGTLMVLLMGVRPLIKALRGDQPKPDKKAKKDKKGKKGAAAEDGDGDDEEEAAAMQPAALAPPAPVEPPPPVDAATLNSKVGLAQQIAQTKPDSAVIALREMLATPPEENAA